MKVCFVVGTLGLGGSERQLIFMLRALIHRGISPRVLCLTQGEHFESDVKKLGVSVEYFGKARSRAGRLLALANKLRSEPADVVQSTHFYTNLYAGVCGKLLGIPSIGAIRSDFISEVEAHGLWGRWQTALPRFLLANSMTAYSNAVDRGIPERKLGLLRNVVPTSDERPARNTDGPFTILFVGRLDENKRPEKFVKLAHTLLNEQRNMRLRFIIAGDGPLRSKLEAMSTKLGITRDQLEFLGAVSDIDSVYRDSHVLVLTSRREGTPNVILEAMAKGLPVVATEGGGTGELLADGRGILVDSESERDLSDAVANLVANADLREQLGREGRSYIEQNHSMSYLEDRLPEIYKGLIQNVG
jgi:glycosyltransferase involved in cell wall biosynthesis